MHSNPKTIWTNPTLARPLLFISIVCQTVTRETKAGRHSIECGLFVKAVNSRLTSVEVSCYSQHCLTERRTVFLFPSLLTCIHSTGLEQRRKRFFPLPAGQLFNGHQSHVRFLDVHMSLSTHTHTLDRKRVALLHAFRSNALS